MTWQKGFTELRKAALFTVTTRYSERAEVKISKDKGAEAGLYELPAVLSQRRCTDSALFSQKPSVTTHKALPTREARLSCCPVEGLPDLSYLTLEVAGLARVRHTVGPSS